MKLEQTGADLVAGDESEAPTEPIAIEPEPPTEAKPSVPEVIAPTEPIAVPTQGLVTQVDRDRGGRSWVSNPEGDRPQAIGMPHLHQ